MFRYSMVFGAAVLLGTTLVFAGHVGFKGADVRDEELSFLYGRTSGTWCWETCSTCWLESPGCSLDSPGCTLEYVGQSCPFYPMAYESGNPEACNPDLGNETCTDTPYDTNAHCGRWLTCECIESSQNNFECVYVREEYWHVPVTGTDNGCNIQSPNFDSKEMFCN